MHETFYFYVYFVMGEHHCKGSISWFLRFALLLPKVTLKNNWSITFLFSKSNSTTESNPMFVLMCCVAQITLDGRIYSNIKLNKIPTTLFWNVHVQKTITKQNSIMNTYTILQKLCAVHCQINLTESYAHVVFSKLCN
jgi:hypothetical protein